MDQNKPERTHAPTATSDAPTPPARHGVHPRYSRQDFQVVLTAALEEAARAGAPCCDVRAADLHARVGGYPARGHSLPTCCSAMREAMKAGDTVLIEPARGHGPAFQVRYLLPR